MKRIVTSCFLIALSVGCSSKSASQQAGGGGGGGGGGTTKVGTDLRVELASVTLADQCGGTNMPPPAVIKTADASTPKRPPASPPADEAPAAMQAKCEPGQNCGGGHQQACEQTSMQLSFASTQAQSAKIEVKKIELLDDSGKLLAELTAQPAMRWNADKYEAWDQMVPAGQTVAASYALSAPPYEKMGGRFEAHGKRFQLRVTVSIGGKDQTVEKKAIAPTMLEPAVPT